MERISENVSYKEAIKSDTAIRHSVLNEPNNDQLKRMQSLAMFVFEPLRNGLGDQPINISSFFRSSDLNSLIHGAENSQHLANNGAAMDIDNDYFVIHGWSSNGEIFNYIKDNLYFDQLIWEFGDQDNPSWVHVSYNGTKNRNEILKAVKIGSRTKYVIYES
jgi:hypothetical protein